MARKILLADDSVTAQNMGRKILADAGYEVITVNNGSAALKKIAELRPDLIVLDVYMPGYSGLEVCQRLKEVAETARIPVLLTVGKLEPFKTDEAKRVRADGFIVKPFEASELLSALSKLEDKIVPRGESKPGRFARATAAIDEARDRTVAADEDNGWKSRIAFPSKKKEPVPEPEADDPAIYNPVNKDLRTVVEHQSPAPIPVMEVAPEEKVDLGALAPEGLPKDVTPEEIAALAAAAAHMQGKILEIKAEDRQVPAEVKAETSQPSAEAIADAPSAAATFAEQTVQASVEEPSPAGETSAGTSQPPAAHEETSRPEATETPVTMAVAAGANSGGTTSRWTAVAVALAPEDSGVSLEQEMQKAYAEFAASHVDSSNPASVPFLTEPVAEISATPDAEGPVAEPSSQTSAIPQPEAELPSSVENTASDVITPTVKEFESVAAPEAIADTPVENAPAVESSVAEPEISQAPEAMQDQAPIAQEASSSEEPKPEEQPEIPAVELHAEAESHETPVATHEVAEAEVAADPSDQSQSSSEVKSEVSEEPVSSVAEKKDPDISETTAAAWATWRKIRESGDAHPADPSRNEKTDMEAVAAAMAAAAGAEKSPEDSMDANSDPAIASIVDSVLADLRPKIVEEISRKLGKKK